MALEQRIRRELSSIWAVENPTLDKGIPGYEIDTKRIKYGDGVTPWNDLAYYSMGVAVTHSQLLGLENDDHGQYLTSDRHQGVHGNIDALSQISLGMDSKLYFRGLPVGSEDAAQYALESLNSATESEASSVSSALSAEAASGYMVETAMYAATSSGAIAASEIAVDAAAEALDSASSATLSSITATAAASQASLSSIQASASASTSVIASVAATAASQQASSIAAALTSVTASSSRTLSNLEVTNTIVDNLGQASGADITLPTAAAGMNFIVIVSTPTSAAWRIRAGASDKLYTNGIAGLDNGYIGITNSTVGSYVSIFSFRTAAGIYDWMAIVGHGNWAIS